MDPAHIGTALLDLNHNRVWQLHAGPHAFNVWTLADAFLHLGVAHKPDRVAINISQCLHIIRR